MPIVHRVAWHAEFEMPFQCQVPAMHPGRRRHCKNTDMNGTTHYKVAQTKDVFVFFHYNNQQHWLRQVCFAVAVLLVCFSKSNHYISKGLTFCEVNTEHRTILLTSVLKSVKEKCLRSKLWNVLTTYSSCCLVLSASQLTSFSDLTSSLCPLYPFSHVLQSLHKNSLRVSFNSISTWLPLTVSSSLPPSQAFSLPSFFSSSHQLLRHSVSMVLPLQSPGCIATPSPSNGFPMLRPSYLSRGHVSCLGTITL